MALRKHPAILIQGTSTLFAHSQARELLYLSHYCMTVYVANYWRHDRVARGTSEFCESLYAGALRV